MRLINADEIQYAKDWVVTDKIPKVGGYNAKAIYRVTKEEIDALPTVDAVPVVRCKDCKFYHRMTAETGICVLACRHLGNDGFCSEGERKDGEHT